MCLKEHKVMHIWSYKRKLEKWVESTTTTTTTTATTIIDNIQVSRSYDDSIVFKKKGEKKSQ